MNNLTQNKNYLSPTGFRVTIDSTQFANLEYFCTHALIPTVNLGEISTPFRKNQNFIPGDRVDYGAFEMKFMVSENMENYIELLNWIRNNADANQYKTSDITLHILSSSNNPNRKVRFVNAFPTSMGSLDFHTQNTDVEYLSLDASFRYTYFEFVT
jgi:hypothetical protein